MVSHSCELPSMWAPVLGIPLPLTLAGKPSPSPTQEHENAKCSLSPAPLQLGCGHMTPALPIRPQASVPQSGVNNIKKREGGVSASSSSQRIRGTVLAGGVRIRGWGWRWSQLRGFALTEGDSGVFTKQVLHCGWPLFCCVILSPVLQKVLRFAELPNSPI